MALVDSGADVTLVDMRFVRQMQPRPKLRDSNLTIRDGQNNEFNVYGLADLQLRGQNGLNLTFPAYVVQGLGSSTIHGWDFQKHTEAVIEPRTIPQFGLYSEEAKIQTNRTIQVSSLELIHSALVCCSGMRPGM